jgi:hypothetical protein
MPISRDEEASDGTACARKNDDCHQRDGDLMSRVRFGSTCSVGRCSTRDSANAVQRIRQGADEPAGCQESSLQTEKGGLDLKLARDQSKTKSLTRSLEKLADVPLSELRARSTAGELNASYFDLLVSDDPVDDLLSWMSQPKATRDKWEVRGTSFAFAIAIGNAGVREPAWQERSD